MFEFLFKENPNTPAFFHRTIWSPSAILHTSEIIHMKIRIENQY
jgi:hypothetical protein